MSRVKKYWTTTDIAKALGVKRQTVVGWVKCYRTFPPPDIELAGWFGWDPGREDEIRKWREDRQHYRGLRGGQSVHRYVQPAFLPPPERKQYLTGQQLKLAKKGFIAVPAGKVRFGDLRPWGGQVNKITWTKVRNLVIIHDDILGADKARGAKDLVMIQARPVSDDD